MTGDDPSAVVRDIQALFHAGAIGGLSDGQLLERYATRRDATSEAAFEALVRRHGPMVWGVCRRILVDPHAAADAFQATFLILAEKAAVVRVDDSLGRWLHGVSRRVAVRARKRADRRSAREVGGVETAATPAPASGRSELLEALDAEIARLPGRYRAAVLLCDLGDLTHEEAARQLGCAVGTIGSRLSRGRERLRDRLTRRGLIPPTGLAAAGFSARTASAAVPAALLHSTARAGSRIVAGARGSATANAVALSKGVLKAMFMTKLKIAAALALLATAGLVAFARVGDAAPEAPVPPEAKQEGAAARPEAGSPEKVLARVTRTYAEARSYEDEGEVVTVFIGPGINHTVNRPFSTKFVRPNRFRFEFTERSGDGEAERHRYVIWTDAAPERSRTWWSIRPLIEERPLGLAIGEAVGISGGSSSTVPNLLRLAPFPSPPFTGLKDVKRVVEEVVDGIPCDKLEGKNLAGNPETVWIGKEDALVRKIFLRFSIPKAEVEQTTTYRPRINVEIPPERFAFEPPKP